MENNSLSLTEDQSIKIVSDILDNMKQNEIYKIFLSKIKKYDVERYAKLCITKINITIFVWLFFFEYYAYMIAILLLEDNMELLNNNNNGNNITLSSNKLIKILLFIPWFIFNGLLNFCMIGAMLNLLGTLLIFSNTSLYLPVSKKLIDWWSIARSINYKKYLKNYN